MPTKNGVSFVNKSQVLKDKNLHIYANVQKMLKKMEQKYMSRLEKVRLECQAKFKEAQQNQVRQLIKEHEVGIQAEEKLSNDTMAPWDDTLFKMKEKETVCTEKLELMQTQMAISMQALNRAGILKEEEVFYILIIGH